MSGIDDQGIRQRPQAGHRLKHRFRLTEAAAADEKCISGKESGIIGGPVTDGIPCMSLSMNTLQKTIPE